LFGSALLTGTVRVGTKMVPVSCPGQEARNPDSGVADTAATKECIAVKNFVLVCYLLYDLEDCVNIVSQALCHFTSWTWRA
jgi:hypothetical protein